MDAAAGDGPAGAPALRVGVRLAQYGGGWEGLLASARRAEALGFDALWVNDHLRTPGRLRSLPAFDALGALAALAPLTSRPRLGVAVLAASYRPAPLAAKATTVIDVLSGGRLVLGLGTGSDAEEHRAYGIPFAGPRERADALETAFEVMRAMQMHPRSATIEGLLDDAQNLPAPVQAPPPIWIAANRRRLLGFAGRRAEGVMVAFSSPEEAGRKLAVARAAREEGDPRPLACGLYTYCFPVASEREADAWLAPEAEDLGTTPRRLRRWLGGTGIVGTPAELRGRLAAFAASGVTDAVLVLPNRVPLEAFDALAEATLPGGSPAIRWPGSGAEPRHNLAHLLVERPREAGRGGDAAVEDEHETLTYDQLAQAASRAAGALRAAGVRRGDRVAVPLRDGAGWMRAVLGAAWLGAVPVPLDPGGAPETLAAILADCEPAAVIAEQDIAPGWAALPPDALRSGPAAPMAAVHPDDLAYLIYSSGSTGRPKAAMHAHRDMAASVETYAATVLGLGPGDRCHSIARLFTSLGFGNGFFRVLGRGATAVLSGTRPTARSAARLAAEGRVTVLTGVPTFWSQLTRFLERHPDPATLATVRLAVSSGDSLPAAVGERFRGLTGLTLIEGLGCSECSNVVISTRPGEPPTPGRLGRVVEGVEVKLADDAGHPVPRGEPGRLWIRSDSNTSGYWRRADLTRELVFGPWLRMGDVLREDEDGVMRHLGRTDDLFKVDAQWVSPTEVEAVLLEHPEVAEAAVVGRPDRHGLLRPAAFVVLAPDATEDGLGERLRAHAAERLRPFAAPATTTVLDELPRLPSGKLDRRTLREGDPA